MPTVKHLVLSAGAQNGFRTYGALRSLARRGIWDPSDIESVWGVSSGAIVGAMVILGYEWEWLDDFLMKRPWHDVLGADERVLDMYAKAGLYGQEVVDEVLGPLLEARGLSRTITLAAFAKATDVDFHCIATNMNGDTGFEKVVFDAALTPDCPLLTAVAGSAAYPMMFKPVRYDGKCLIDGGVHAVYPLTEALATGANPENTLGIRNHWGQQCTPISDSANLLDFSSALLSRFWQGTCSSDHLDEPPAGLREVACLCAPGSWRAIRDAIADEAERRRLVGLGEADAESARITWETTAAPPRPPLKEMTSETGEGM